MISLRALERFIPILLYSSRKERIQFSHTLVGDVDMFFERLDRRRAEYIGEHISQRTDLSVNVRTCAFDDEFPDSSCALLALVFAAY